MSSTKSSKTKQIEAAISAEIKGHAPGVWVPPAHFTKPKLVVPDYTLEWAFPKVEAQLRPFGSRILVQVRRARTHTAGGIEIPVEVRDTEKCNTNVAKVVAVGPCAFRNRDTLEPWPEGAWCKVGDFIWTPQYGGQSHEPRIPGTQERAKFRLINDLDLLGDCTIDPRDVMAYL